MNTPSERDNALREQGEVGTANSDIQGELCFAQTPLVKAISAVANSRERRLFAALLDHVEISRHDLDRMIGAENSPDVVMRAKRKYGIQIEMTKRPFVDRDGKSVRVGFYSLCAAERPKVAHWLASQQTGGIDCTLAVLIALFGIGALLLLGVI